MLNRSFYITMAFFSGAERNHLHFMELGRGGGGDAGGGAPIVHNRGGCDGL